MIIPAKKVKVGEEIGRGSYGRVFEIEWGRTHYAAKEVHSVLIEPAGEGRGIKASFIRECHIWSQLRHPRIVQFIGSFIVMQRSLQHIPVACRIL